MRRVAAFFRLARPAFLLGGFAGFGLGAAVAHYDGAAFSWSAYVWGQVMVTAFHLMVHFSNDYFDQASDALAERTAWSGGSGVLTRGELPPALALVAARACAAIGLLAIVRSIVTGDDAVALTGLAIAAGAWIYSAPPLRLLERGLGELDTVLVVAVLVPIAGYASLTHTFGAHVLIAAAPGAFAMFAMMLSVEIPDARADKATGKRNLVVRWGVETAAILARTFASGAVLLLLLAGNTGFGAPAPAFLTLVPVAIVAGAFAVPHMVAHLPFMTLPFLGVALYGLTACAGIVLVLAASL